MTINNGGMKTKEFYLLLYLIALRTFSLSPLDKVNFLPVYHLMIYIYMYRGVNIKGFYLLIYSLGHKTVLLLPLSVVHRWVVSVN